MTQKLINCLCSSLLICFTFFFYYSIPYYQQYHAGQIRFFSFAIEKWTLLAYAFSTYTCILFIYYLFAKTPQKSKSVYCLHAIFKLVSGNPINSAKNLSREERLGVLSFLLKAFFAPLMIVWTTDHAFTLLQNGFYIATHSSLITEDFLRLFNSHGFWFLLQIILFFDVLFFTLGYLIELPMLKNRIRSVDPTLLGWCAALACYPPFNIITSNILGWEAVQFPQFDDVQFHLTVNFMLLGLMAIYSWASVALNFKASNLTHRGIICSGPYRYIRHPAYACKNISWWLAALPALIECVNTADWWHLLLALASIAGWTFIYTLRALTEEDHLKSVDHEYADYCKKVKARFVPGIF